MTAGVCVAILCSASREVVRVLGSWAAAATGQGKKQPWLVLTTVRGPDQ